MMINIREDLIRFDTIEYISNVLAKMDRMSISNMFSKEESDVYIKMAVKIVRTIENIGWKIDV